MEMRLLNGDYVPDDMQGFETVSGYEEKLERMLYKLSCRKGGFAPFPKLGSELYKLLREKKENYTVQARKYILEALEDEGGIDLTSVEVTQTDGGLLVKAEFAYSGETIRIGVNV